MNQKEKQSRKGLTPNVRLEVVKIMFYFEHKSVTEIATELGVDKSTICRDLKKIKEDFQLKKLDVDEMAAVIQLRANIRQRELLKIYHAYPNPNVRISCLRHMREEDKNLIDLLRSLGELRKNPLHHEEKKPIHIIYTNEKPPSRDIKNLSLNQGEKEKK